MILVFSHCASSRRYPIFPTFLLQLPIFLFLFLCSLEYTLFCLFLSCFFNVIDFTQQGLQHSIRVKSARTLLFSSSSTFKTNSVVRASLAGMLMDCRFRRWCWKLRAAMSKNLLQSCAIKDQNANSRYFLLESAAAMRKCLASPKHSKFVECCGLRWQVVLTARSMALFRRGWRRFSFKIGWLL